MSEEQQPGFEVEYVPATTILEADTDLQEILAWSLKMTAQSMAMRPAAANLAEQRHTLEEIQHHLARAESLCRWLMSVHGGKP